MKRAYFFIPLLIPALAGADTPRLMIVKVPVADVRSERVPATGDYANDPKQETQVTLGEPVYVHEIDGKWVRIEAIEQEEFTHNNRWEGYPGWVRRGALSNKSALRRKIEPFAGPPEKARAAVLAQAEKHIGNRYLWGGRSLHDPAITGVATGVDCSGLINWSFREIGRLVPRDAHEQWMRARRIEPAALEPGDLVFLAKADKPDRIVHVMFYAGEEMLLEAPQTGEAVRRISIQDRLGTARTSLSNGATAGDRVIYFGTLFGEAP